MLRGLHKKTEAVLRNTWLKTNYLSLLLLPVSLMYRFATSIRRIFYGIGVFRIHKVDALVIVVGNVIVGGAGKTPTAIELIKHLQSKGISVGAISRGFGRIESHCLEVTEFSSPTATGDEPKLIQCATKVPVFVAKTRHASATALLTKYPAIQAIVCDDGLQHYGLFRDLEICVFDNRGIGNGRLLPSGPLREPWPRAMLAKAGQGHGRSMVLHTGGRPAFDGFKATRQLSPQGKKVNGDSVNIRSLGSSVDKPLMAVAGIAQPENFFDMLKGLGLEIQNTHALPDHFDFKDFDSQMYSDYQILCTEKDASKLWTIVPSAISVALIQEADSDFYELFDSKIAALLAHNPLTHHGYKTT